MLSGPMMTPARDEMRVPHTRGVSAAVANHDRHLIEMFLCERQEKSATLNSYKQALRRWQQYCQAQGVPLQFATAEMVDGFESWLSAPGRTTRAVDFDLSVIRHLYDYLESRSLVLQNPARRINRSVLAREIPQILRMRLDATFPTARFKIRLREAETGFPSCEIFYARGEGADELGVGATRTKAWFHCDGSVSFVRRASEETEPPHGERCCELLDLQVSWLKFCPCTPREFVRI